MAELTGRQRVRVGFCGVIILQVEECHDAGYGHDVQPCQCGQKVSRWRDAKAEDVTTGHLGAAVIRAEARLDGAPATYQRLRPGFGGCLVVQIATERSRAMPILGRFFSVEQLCWRDASLEDISVGPISGDLAVGQGNMP